MKHSYFKIVLACLCIGMGCLSCSNDRDKESVGKDKLFVDIHTDATKLFNEGKIRQSILFIDSAYAAQAHITRYGYYLIHSFKAQVFYYARDIASADKYADSALAVMKDEVLRKKYPGDHIHALLEKGHILSAQKNFDGAHDYYANALQQAKDVMNNCSLNEYYYHVGMALYKEQQYERSAAFFKDGFRAGLSCPVTERPYMRMQEMLANTGLCYHVINELDSAVHYFDSCISFINMNERYFTDKKVADDGRSVAYGNRGMSLVNAKKFEEAERSMQKCVSLNIRNNADPVRVRAAKIKLATLYIDAKKYSQGYAAIRDITSSLDSLPDGYIVIEMEDLLSDYYMATGQFEKAANAILFVARSNDSMSKAKIKDRESDVLRDLKEKEQQYHIRLLQKDNHYQAVRSKVIIAFALMSVVILVMIFASYRRAHKNEQLLSASNKEISAQKAALEKSNKEKDHILGVVAHDLRNPVGAVSFLADMLLDDDDDAVERAEILAMIKTSSVGALHLINELVGSVGEEQREIKKEPTDAVALVKETMRMMDYRLKEKRQTIRPDMPDDPLIASFDKEKIRRVINNLVGNAVKFTPEDGSIGISVSKQNDHLIITVQDNGIGIPAEMIPDLFGTSGKARRTGTSGEKSFGLGLSISRQIVEAHGGSIWVESEEGKGSTFFVQLPVYRN